MGEQRRPGRHPATARMMWSKDVNKVVKMLAQKEYKRRHDNIGNSVVSMT